MDLVTPSGGLLFWMVIIFAVVFFILAKMGFPVITKMVAKRNEHIAQGLKDAEEAGLKLKQMQQTCDKMLDEVRLEQQKMLSQAHASAQSIVDEATARAKEQAADILAKAREEIEVEKNEILAEVRGEVLNIAVTVAEKILREQLSTNEAQKKLVDKLIEEQLNGQRNNIQ